MDILNMHKILYFAFTLGVFLTPFATAAPLCQSPLVATTQRGSAEGSAKILFLCEGVVVHELPGFSTPAYSPNRKFIIMHEAEADDDTQLYLFPTNANGLPDYKRSIGAFGGRYRRFIAWNQNSQGFFLFCRGCHGPTDRVGEKFSYYHIVAKGETLASIAEGYLGRDGSQQVGAIINANPWLKDLDQSVASESRLHPWGRVIKDWDRTQSDVPENLLLNISNVMLEN
jgi:hypothetical protein